MKISNNDLSKIEGILNRKILSSDYVNQGTCHDVWKVDLNGLSVIYKLPRHDTRKQIDRQVLANKIFQPIHILPALIHHDDKCIIEEYIPGDSFSLFPNWTDLGTALNRVHQFESEGYGRISQGCSGFFDSFVQMEKSVLNDFRSYFLKTNLFDTYSKYLFMNILEDMPKPAYNQSFYCHSDLDSDHIILDSKRREIRLIDWEALSSNFREFDFRHLNVINDGRIEKVCSSYSHDLNFDLINYFSLIKLISKVGRCELNRDDKKLEKTINLLTKFCQRVYGFNPI